MALTDLYTHPGDGRINLYWRRTSGTGLISIDYTLDSTLSTGWTSVSSNVASGTTIAFHSLTNNSATPYYYRVNDGGTPCTFPDAAYAYDLAFKDQYSSASGFYVIPLGQGAKCIFVAATSSTPAGNDSNDGLSVATPKATYSSAASIFNAGDHILFKRGSTITYQIGIPAEGLSRNKLSALGAYGPISVERPISITSDIVAVDLTSNRSKVAITSFKLISGSRTTVNGVGLFFLGYADKFHTDFYTDDVHCEGFQVGMVIEGGADASTMTVTTELSGFVVSRSTLYNNYGYLPDGGGHSQGLFAGELNDCLFEDIIAINNGFNLSVGRPNTIFNHNMYISEFSNNVHFRNIISIGNDLQCRPNGIYERMLFVNCPLSFNTTSRGFVSGSPSGYWGDFPSIASDCFIDGSTDTDDSGLYNRGWGPIVGDIGQTGGGVVTLNNILINLASGVGGLTNGNQIQQIYIGAAASNNNCSCVISGCVIVDASNRFYQGAISMQNPQAYLSVLDTTFDLSADNPIIGSENNFPSAMYFGGNTYYSLRDVNGTGVNTWFNYGGVSGYALSSWLALTHDPSFGLTQSVSSTSKPTFAEKRRTPDYAAHIGLSPQVSAFEAALLGQRKGNWDPRLTAEYAIDWMRQGYGMAPLLSSGGSSPTTPVYKFMYNGNKIYIDSQGRVLFLTYN